MGNDLGGNLVCISREIFQEDIQAGEEEFTSGEGKQLEDMAFDDPPVKKKKYP